MSRIERKMIKQKEKARKLNGKRLFASKKEISYFSPETESYLFRADILDNDHKEFNMKHHPYLKDGSNYINTSQYRKMGGSSQPASFDLEEIKEETEPEIS